MESDITAPRWFKGIFDFGSGGRPFLKSAPREGPIRAGATSTRREEPEGLERIKGSELRFSRGTLEGGRVWILSFT